MAKKKSTAKTPRGNQWVKMLTSIGGQYRASDGDVILMDNDNAKRCIAKGLAEPAKAPEVS